MASRVGFPQKICNLLGFIITPLLRVAHYSRASAGHSSSAQKESSIVCDINHQHAPARQRQAPVFGPWSGARS